MIYSNISFLFPLGWYNYSAQTNSEITIFRLQFDLRPWLVESSVIVPFCITTLMHNAVSINYQLFLYQNFVSKNKKQQKNIYIYIYFFSWLLENLWWFYIIIIFLPTELSANHGLMWHILCSVLVNISHENQAHTSTL